MTLSLVCDARSMRTVKGITANENGVMVPNVVLKVDGVSAEFNSGRTGQFEISIPLESKTMTAFAEGYSATEVNISGQFVIVRLASEGKVSATNAADAENAVHQTPAPAATQPVAE